METWGDKPKSQVDPATVDEEIAALIAAHEADSDSHLEVGESLQSHKASEIIDHLAKSIVEDKIDDLAISSRCITTDQIVGKDIRTAEDVGAGVDGVVMKPTGIEMWQGGDRKVNIPISGSPEFKGVLTIDRLLFSNDILQTYWDSLDTFDVGGGGYVVVVGQRLYILFYDDKDYTATITAYRIVDFTKHSSFSTVCMVASSSLTNLVAYIIAGYWKEFSSHSSCYGFKIVDNHLYAYHVKGDAVSNAEYTTDLGPIISEQKLILAAEFFPGDHIDFYLNGSLVATHSANLPDYYSGMSNYIVFRFESTLGGYEKELFVWPFYFSQDF